MNRQDDDDLVLDDGEEGGEADELPAGYAVLLRWHQEWSFQDVSAALRDYAGFSVADAARIAKKRPGILAEGLEPEIAKDLVRALRGLQIDCFLVPESELFPPFVGIHVESLDVKDEGFRAVVSHAIGTSATFPWLDVAFLALGHIAGTGPGGDIHTSIRRGKTGLIAPRPGVLSFAPGVKKKDHYALDIHCGFTRRDPGTPMRGTVLSVNASDFHFGCLEENHGVAPADNVVRLCRLLAARAPHAALSPGAAASLSGDSARIPAYDHLPDFHAENLWLLDLQELERRKRERERQDA